jgi:DNA-binding NarL/FixJ family response regulator
MSARPITIMIIDDHVVIRSGLRMLIEHDQHMKVVAQAGSRTEALERAASTNPDVIILDLLLGDEDGLSFLPELCQASPNSRVLVLTGVQMMGSMIQEFNKPAMVDPEVSKIESLTDREREVIALIGEGLKNKQVGERLFISETTVTHHLSSVFSKLEVSDRLELIIYAFRHGLAKMPK